MQKTSYWLNDYGITINNENFKNKCDVLIIGAGIAGIMVAYEISKTNQNIILVDSKKIAQGVSSKTTAKVTYMHNLIYKDIKKAHGIEAAKSYLEYQKNAMENILSNIKNENIDCDLMQVNNYEYATTSKGAKDLTDEYEILKTIGADVSYVNEIPLNITIKKAIVTETAEKVAVQKLIFRYFYLKCQFFCFFKN